MLTMTKLSLGCAALTMLLIAGPAVAADMPLKAPPMAPIATNWAGAYVGVNGGWGRADATWTFPNAQFFATVGGQNFTINPSGGLVGGHIGYNFQGHSWVFGVELAGDWTNLSQTVVGPVPAFPFDSFTTKVTDLETLTTRIGYAPGNWLFYAKGGAASASVQLSGISGLPVPNVAFSNRERIGGVTVGGGIETIWAGHFIFGIEYNYVALEDSIHENAACIVAATCGARSAPVNMSSNNLRIESLLGRVSYKF